MPCVLDSLFRTLARKTYNTVFMFEIFHLQSNAGLKASSGLMHMITFILRNSK